MFVFVTLKEVSQIGGDLKVDLDPAEETAPIILSAHPLLPHNTSRRLFIDRWIRDIEDNTIPATHCF